MNDLFQAYASGLPKLQLRLDLESAEFQVDLAVSWAHPNELATNAFKHAFCDRDSGEIHIKLQTAPTGETAFVRRQRRGLPCRCRGKARIRWPRLVRMLNRQLGGRIEMRSDEGTIFELSFRSIRSYFYL